MSRINEVTEVNEVNEVDKVYKVLDFKIDTEMVYGKLLGGCLYAGMPIDMTMYIRLNKYMLIEKQFILCFDEEGDMRFLVSNKYLEDWHDMLELSPEAFEVALTTLKEFDVEYYENYKDEQFFRIGELKIVVTEQTKPYIEEFIRNYTRVLRDFYDTSINYYNKHIDIIKR